MQTYAQAQKKTVIPKCLILTKIFLKEALPS